MYPHFFVFSGRFFFPKESPLPLLVLPFYFFIESCCLFSSLIVLPPAGAPPLFLVDLPVTLVDRMSLPSTPGQGRLSSPLLHCNDEGLVYKITSKRTFLAPLPFFSPFYRWNISALIRRKRPPLFCSTYRFYLPYKIGVRLPHSR